MNQKRQWVFRLSLPNIILLIAAIVINLFGNWLSECLLLPFWLDSIGTIFAAGILGPFAGGLAGGISGCMNAALASASAAYAITGILVAAIVAVLASTPINIICYSGYTRNLWGDALIDMMLQSGNSRIFSAVLGEALVDIPDKVISVFLAAGAAKIWCRFYPAAKKGGCL